MTLADYDRENRQLVVRHSTSGKPRYVALEEDLVPFLDDWRRERPNEAVLRGREWFQGDDPWVQPVRPTLFVSEGGKQMVQNYWGCQFRRCGQATRQVALTEKPVDIRAEGLTIHGVRALRGRAPDLMETHQMQPGGSHAREVIGAGMLDAAERAAFVAGRAIRDGRLGRLPVFCARTCAKCEHRSRVRDLAREVAG